MIRDKSNQGESRLDGTRRTILLGTRQGDSRHSDKNRFNPMRDAQFSCDSSRTKMSQNKMSRTKPMRDVDFYPMRSETIQIDAVQHDAKLHETRRRISDETSQVSPRRTEIRRAESRQRNPKRDVQFHPMRSDSK
jgi:hypothetical protein